MSSKTLRYAVTLVTAGALCVMLDSSSSAAPGAGAACAAQADALAEGLPSCVSAAVALDRLPAVGESATVRVALGAKTRVDGARLTLRLPASLRLETGGTGLSAPRPVGLDQVAEQTFALTTTGRSVSVRVTALAAGPAQIQADVAGADDKHAAHASTEFTVGATPGTSRSGLGGTSGPAVTRIPARVATNGKAAPLAAQAPAAAAAAGQICATGYLSVSDKTGAWIAARNVPVYVQGKTTSAAATVTYQSGLTNYQTGGYSLCFTAPVTQMYSVWVSFSTAGSLWQVTDLAGTSAYTTYTAAKGNVASGATLDFGTIAPPSTQMRGWHAFDTLNLLWYVRASGTNCWTSRQTSGCTKISLRWQPGSTEGARFNNSVPQAQRYVLLGDADPDSEHLVLHESGHAFMDQLYNGYWPTSDCPSPHYLHARTGPKCAWTEGFANAIAGYTKGDGRYYWADGGTIDLMTTAWFDSSKPAGRTNVENGDQVECRVAGSLIDLWRKVDNGPASTFSSMVAYRSDTFSHWFKTVRPARGLSVTASTRNLVYTHTIDYRTS
ncbi:hypothetical protein [Actinokineospora sp. NBRC 105648]|uniref:hypothetical protein n=1 Tax=Actinokineospora sp. NBRC 105648 TaxID=3032206 RepID=UPI0024A21340|nr:hypothetical protein [Actinokineospora sp. NBRC 105648]GLZ42214.1 hypothetical protein Acsp05_58380 [Actinokineospora sp. NBRC 105648]